MSGSRLDRLGVALDALLADLVSFGGPLFTTRVQNVRDAWSRVLDTSTDETGPAPAVSAEQAAELAPDTRPSVAPTAAQAEAVGVARVEAAKPSALEQAAEALRASLELWSLGQQSRAERMIDRFGVGERSDSIQAEIRAALARIEADANAVATIGEIAEAERRGYAACQADVVAHYAASPDDMEIDDFVESVDLSGHIDAAARAKEKP